MARRFQRSEVFRLTLARRTLSLWRPATGLRISVELANVGPVRDALALLARGSTGAQVQAALSPLGRDARPLWQLWREHGVIRAAWDGASPGVRGEGVTARQLRRLLGAGGWRLPPLRARDALGARPSSTPGEVVIGPWGRAVFALRGDASPCERCLALRLLARSGRSRRPALPGPAVLRALLAEVLLDLERAPLRPGQAAGAFLGEGVRRVMPIAHPDCPRCAPPRPKGLAQAVRRIRSALAAPPRRAHRAAWQRYVDPAVGPLEILEVAGRPGRYPFDAPFVWGSVYLARALRGRVRNLSTHGGVYGSGPEARRSLLLATSEGAERLAARGARPDAWAVGARTPRAVPLGALYGWASRRDESRRRAFCHALDLVSGRGRWVPFEAVVVGLPEDLYPESCHREPFYSGTASHRTLAEAVLHGSVELLARDAFMISWYRRRALPRVSWPRRPSPVARARLDYLRAKGLRLELFDLRLDLPLPLLLLRITSPRRRGSFPAGGSILIPSGGFTAMEALEHGLSLACGQFISLALHPAPFKEPLDPRAVRRFSRRAPFWPLLARYLDRRRRAAHGFLGRGEVKLEAIPGRAVRSPAEGIRRLRAWLGARGMGWLVVRLTDPQAAEAGFEVAKVIIPGLVAIAPSRSSANLSLPRMAADWPGATVDGLNADPHPLY